MATNRALVDKLGLGFPVLSDPDGAASRAFGVFDGENEIAWPAVYIVDPSGTIVQRWLADTYQVRIETSAILADLLPQSP